MEYRGDIGRLQVRSQEKGWRVGIEDAGMMNASVACREEDGESDETKPKCERDVNAERTGREWGGPALRSVIRGTHARPPVPSRCASTHHPRSPVNPNAG